MVKNLFFSCLICTTAFSLELVSPIFDRLEEDELTPLSMELTAQPDKTFSTQLDLALTQYFLAELSSLRFDRASADLHLSEVLSFCATHESDDFERAPLDPPKRFKSRAAYLCALAETEKINREPFFLQLQTARRIEKNLQLGSSSDPDAQEKLYTEGRVFGALPAAWGQNFRRSLVSLTLLSRERPDLVSLPFLLGRTYYWQGNVPRAEQLLSQAKGNRASFFYANGEFIAEQAHNDGVLRGFYPGLFYSLAQGAGVQLAWAEPLWSRVTLATKLAVATRPVFEAGIRLTYRDQVRAPHWGYQLEVRGFYGKEDFYGLGVDAPFGAKSELTAYRSQTRLFFLFASKTHFFLKAGMEAQLFTVSTATGEAFGELSLPDRQTAQGYGPTLQIGWDTRDSAQWPRQGALVRFSTFAALAALGTPRPYQETRLEGRHFVRLAKQHTLSFHLMADALTGDVPFGAFPRVTGTLRLPAVRSNRYRDQALLAGYLEYDGKITGPLHGLAFLEGLQTGSNLSKLLASRIAWGGGAGFDIELTRYRSDHVRFEAGLFSGEFSVRAYGGKRF